MASAAAEAKRTRVQEKYEGHVLDETTAEELEDTKGRLEENTAAQRWKQISFELGIFDM